MYPLSGPGLCCRGQHPEAFNRMLYRNAAKRPGAQRTLFTLHQFNPQSVKIREREIRLANPGNLSHRNLVSGQPLLPESEGAGRYSISGHTDLSSADSAFAAMSPREECDDRTRRTLLIAEVEVVDLGGVEIDGFFDEPQA